jgi:hypothetical protein
VATSSAAGAAPRTAVRQFTFAADVPAARAQPTSKGQQILDLQAFEGRVYPGFGDYNANTGPIAVAPLTPGVGFNTEYVADTEAIYNFRAIDGRLFAPSTDPRMAADFAANGPWTSGTSLGAAHVFDTASLGAGDLWMVGSQGYDAVAWHSTDGGATWEVALRRSSAMVNDAARFYFAGVLDGRLYVQAVDGQGPRATSDVFDGSTWSAGPSVIGRQGFGWRPVEFNGSLFLHSLGHGLAGSVLSFDGRRTSRVASGYDVEVAEGILLLLTDTGEVRTSRDGRRWTTAAQAPATARSVTLLNGTIYVGTTSGQLWTAPLA